MTGFCSPSCGDCCARIWVGWSLEGLEVKAAQWRSYPDPRIDSDAFLQGLVESALYVDWSLTWAVDGHQLDAVCAVLDNADRVPQIWTLAETGKDKHGNEVDYFRYECSVFDPVTRRCTQHEDRPPVCRQFPWYNKPPTRDGRMSGRCTYNEDVRPLLPIVSVT